MMPNTIIDTMENSKNTVPENFRSVIVDFTVDLSTTFPEYAYLWAKWANPALTEKDFQELFDYCLGVYPERFFDILNQSDKIFAENSEINTFFLPDVDFKTLFLCKGITETTSKSMWKYLQLILFTIVGSVQDKSSFGSSANLFEGVDETELQSKLAEAMSGISEFFTKMGADKDEPRSEASQDVPGEEQQQQTEGLPNGLPDFKKFADMFGKGNNPFSNMAKDLPDPEKLHEHIKQIMGGKIGALATELAEEISKDFSDILGDADKDVKTPQDVFKKIAKNPKKMMDMVKTVGSKLYEKMKSGEINREDIMKEASEIMRHMKEMGGGSDQFSEMMKQMANMKMPKNARMDVAAMERMTKLEATKERLRNKLKAKQTENYSISQADTDPNKFVFRTADGSVQERSQKVQGYIDPSLLADPIVGIAAGGGGDAGKKKKKKGKK